MTPDIPGKGREGKGRETSPAVPKEIVGVYTVHIELFTVTYYHMFFYNLFSITLTYGIVYHIGWCVQHKNKP